MSKKPTRTNSNSLRIQLAEAEVVNRRLQDEKARLRVLLEHARCPNCDGSGSIPQQVAEQEWEAEQCQWCYERFTALKGGADDER